MNTLELAMQVLESSKGVIYWANQCIESSDDSWRKICKGCAYTELERMDDTWNQLNKKVKSVAIHSLLSCMSDARMKIEDMRS